MKARTEGSGLRERGSQMFHRTDHSECLRLMQRRECDQLVQFVDIGFIQSNRSCETIAAMNHPMARNANRSHVEMCRKHFKYFRDDSPQILSCLSFQTNVKGSGSFGQMEGEGASAEIHQSFTDATCAMDVTLKQTDLQRGGAHIECEKQVHVRHDFSFRSEARSKALQILVGDGETGRSDVPLVRMA